MQPRAPSPAFGVLDCPTSCAPAVQADLETAIAAARRYAGIAPGSPHAQHMPSHIHSMLRMWPESIAAGRMVSVVHATMSEDTAWMDAADPHGMDFIAYAHLQLGQDDAVQAALAGAGPSDERVLVMARYLLEREDWAAASAMPMDGLSPFQSLTTRFVRGLGAARSANPAARDEVAALRALHDPVLQEDGAYWAGLVDVYAGAADAWMLYAAGDAAHVLTLMRQTADADDARERHIPLENKLVPMRKLYGDLLLAEGRPPRRRAGGLRSQPTHRSQPLPDLSRRPPRRPPARPGRRRETLRPVGRGADRRRRAGPSGPRGDPPARATLTQACPPAPPTTG